MLHVQYNQHFTLKKERYIFNYKKTYEKFGISVESLGLGLARLLNEKH